MNRKGDEKILIVYWFAIFVIIAIAVTSGVISFYGNPFDVREKESEIFIDKFIECFVDKGVLINDFDKINSKNIEERCDIYFKDYSSSYEEEQFFVSLSIPEKDYLVEAGNLQLNPLCGSAKSEIRKPYCTGKRFFAFDGEEMVLIEIKGGISKIAQNAR